MPLPKITAPLPDSVPEGVTLREFDDPLATRKAIYDGVFNAVKTLPPMTDGKVTLGISNPHYADPERFSRKRRKQAVLGGETLSRRLRGTWTLSDNATGEVLDKQERTIARVPYMSSAGTFTHNGNEYGLINQQRMRSGSFTRRKANGEIENHLNLLPGSGPSHRYFLDPAKSQFKINIDQSEIPLLPLLRVLGANNDELKNAWGPEVLAANAKYDDIRLLDKLRDKFVPVKERDMPGDIAGKLKVIFEKMRLDPIVTGRTLGKPHDRLTKEAVLDVTKRLLDVSNGRADTDDRDSLVYQTFHGPEDFFSERITKDHGRLQKNLFWKMARERNLSKLPSGALTDQLEQALLGSGLGQYLEEINPLELVGKSTRVSRLGEGSIGSVDAIPMEARAVQPSQMGFIDPSISPESLRIGVDGQMARGARKGSDGLVYTRVLDRQGRGHWKSPQDLADKALAFAGEKGPHMLGIRNGKEDWLKPEEVDYIVPHHENTYNAMASLVPFKSAMRQQRISMGARMLTQALPLRDPEAPLVRMTDPDNPSDTLVRKYGEKMGAIFAKSPGRVESIRDGVVKVNYEDGKRDEFELYQEHPFNRKTLWNQTALLKPGDTFRAGQPIVRSNFTDGEGNAALGLNARTAYMVFEGRNYEDANVVSESFAKRLTSEHAYQHGVDLDDNTKVGRNEYIQAFPGKYTREVLDRFDPSGLPKVGQTVEKGDPLILGITRTENAANRIHRKGQAGFRDASVTWDHQDPGVVTDVAQTKNGPVVVVKAYSPARVGDKLSNTFGGKGVIAAIVPDHRMPMDSQGRPFEFITNPKGTISRGNPAQYAEAMLGAIAAKTGKPFHFEDFKDAGGDNDLMKFVARQLKEHGVADTEDVTDPVHGKIPGIGTGMAYILKLQHVAEAKAQGRGTGGYSSDETPGKGGKSGSKRIGGLDTAAALAHGATGFLQDGAAVRGQSNEDDWLRYMRGDPMLKARVPLRYHKFLGKLRASGIDMVTDKAGRHRLMPMTDAAVDRDAGDRVVTSGDTVNFDDGLTPIKGGLFDPAITGGHNSRQWSKILLEEPMPSPVYEEPIRRLLGLTKNKFEAILSGAEQLPGGGTGPKAVHDALKSVNVPRELALARAAISSGRKTKRDEAVRKLGYLKTLQENGMSPAEWMMSRVPVLPPIYRPVSVLGGSGAPLVSDANHMYGELINANKNLKAMREGVGDEGAGQEKLALYKAFKAVAGLDDPAHPKLREKGVKGLLSSIFSNSPKHSTVQRQLVSSTVDNVGRGTIIPNPDLDMDELGLPEEKAFDVYGKYVVRRLARRGMPLSQAVQAVVNRDPKAKDALLEEFEARPVVMNRAPVLHKYGIMAFRPKLVAGDSVHVCPQVFKPFGMDSDGDAVQFHAPASERAVEDAYGKMLPSRNTISQSDFRSATYGPQQEYLSGLYRATKDTSERRPRVFATTADALTAIRRREIKLDDPIEILDHKET